MSTPITVTAFDSFSISSYCRPTETPYTRYNPLYNRLYSRLYNRLHRVYAAWDAENTCCITFDIISPSVNRSHNQHSEHHHCCCAYRRSAGRALAWRDRATATSSSFKTSWRRTRPTTITFVTPYLTVKNRPRYLLLSVCGQCIASRSADFRWKRCTYRPNAMLSANEINPGESRADTVIRVLLRYREAAKQII